MAVRVRTAPTSADTALPASRQSTSGFPTEDFGDLALPVVRPDGDLNLNALETAHGVGALDGIDDDAVGSIRDLLEELATSESDHEVDG